MIVNISVPVSRRVNHDVPARCLAGLICTGDVFLQERNGVSILDLSQSSSVMTVYSNASGSYSYRGFNTSVGWF